MPFYDPSSDRQVEGGGGEEMRDISFAEPLAAASRNRCQAYAKCCAALWSGHGALMDVVLPSGLSQLHICHSQSPLDSGTVAVTRCSLSPFHEPGLCQVFPRMLVPGELVLSPSACVPLPLLYHDLSCIKSRGFSSRSQS